MEALVIIMAIAFAIQVLRTKAKLAAEPDVPSVPILGKAEVWSDSRAVIVWGIAGLPVHATTFYHSTAWFD